MTEYQQQYQLIKWTQSTGIRSKHPELKKLLHIPNGGFRNLKEAKHLKDIGVKRGVPDLFLPVSRRGFHGLWIEMKTEGGRTTPDQCWWIEALTEEGFYCEVCWSWQAASTVLLKYLEGERAR